MALFEYDEDGLGSIYGVGLVYRGLVVDSDAVVKDEDGEPVLDLANDARFVPATASVATTAEEIRDVVNAHPAVEDDPVLAAVANPAPVVPAPVIPDGVVVHDDPVLAPDAQSSDSQVEAK